MIKRMSSIVNMNPQALCGTLGLFKGEGSIQKYSIVCD